MEVVGDTGRLVAAVVEGFRSWAVDGLCLIEADCMVDANSMAGFDMMKECATWSINSYCCCPQ